MKTPLHHFAPGTLQQMPTRAPRQRQRQRQRQRVTLAVALWFAAIALGVVAAIVWGDAL
jgi:ABC-type lipoprotein release transport system permease subunit